MGFLWFSACHPIHSYNNEYEGCTMSFYTLVWNNCRTVQNWKISPTRAERRSTWLTLVGLLFAWEEAGPKVKPSSFEALEDPEPGLLWMWNEVLLHFMHLHFTIPTQLTPCDCLLVCIAFISDPTEPTSGPRKQSTFQARVGTEGRKREKVRVKIKPTSPPFQSFRIIYIAFLRLDQLLSVCFWMGRVFINSVKPSGQIPRDCEVYLCLYPPETADGRVGR